MATHRLNTARQHGWDSRLLCKRNWVMQFSAASKTVGSPQSGHCWRMLDLRMTAIQDHMAMYQVHQLPGECQG